MALDVYRDWLGITEAARPLNYYQLLKLKQFEDDAPQIRGQYRKFNADVRKYAAGQFGEQSQILLNELAKAMLCLTDAKRKVEYDASLGRTGGESERRTFEQILVARKVLDSQALDKARRYSKTVNVEIRDAVLQLKLASPELVMQSFAEAEGLPYLDLADVQLDEQIVPKVPAVLARQQSCAPLMIDDGQLLVVSPNLLAPEIEDQLRLRVGAKTVRTVLCTPAAINELIGKFYPKEAQHAQMAAAAAAPKTAAAAQAAALAAAKGSAPAAAPAAFAPRLTADARDMLKREQLKYTLVFAGLTFGLLSVALNFTPLLAARMGIMSYVYQTIAAAVVAAIVYVVKSPK
jgi:hypothetical protein